MANVIDCRKLCERLVLQVKSAENFLHILSRLSERINELQEFHEEVKSKSLVMQSLWDGLVTRQVPKKITISQ
jgi:hypothetical protein